MVAAVVEAVAATTAAAAAMAEAAEVGCDWGMAAVERGVGSGVDSVGARRRRWWWRWRRQWSVAVAAGVDLWPE